MAIEDEQMHDGDAPDTAAERTTLFGTELLSPDETERLLRGGPARLIVWIGEEGAGKTTLCVELYEQQRRGNDGVAFAGSWTLLALEQLAHRRRTTGSLPPAGPAGAPDGRDVLHLALSAGGAPMHLLFADLPGALFRRLADNQLAVGELPWLRRADKLVLLVDGERLADRGTRSSTLTRTRQLIERLRSAVLPRDRAQRLALLVTKWDLVSADPEAVAYWEPREAELLNELRYLDGRATALRVGAGNGSAPYGLATLRAWLLEIAPPQEQAPAPAVRRVAMPQPAAAAPAPAAASRPPVAPIEQPTRVEPPPVAAASGPEPAVAPEAELVGVAAADAKPAARPQGVPLATLERFQWPAAEEPRRGWRPWRWRQ